MCKTIDKEQIKVAGQVEPVGEEVKQCAAEALDAQKPAEEQKCETPDTTMDAIGQVPVPGPGKGKGTIVKK